ncbi:MAG: hypothetical protein Q8R28_10935 [Dehalococcoidia bacterium]|nr:hypothetical protein [Dehalococcoidia bacterium]
MPPGTRQYIIDSTKQELIAAAKRQQAANAAVLEAEKGLREASAVKREATRQDGMPGHRPGIFKVGEGGIAAQAVVSGAWNRTATLRSMQA